MPYTILQNSVILDWLYLVTICLAVKLQNLDKRRSLSFLLQLTQKNIFFTFSLRNIKKILWIFIYKLYMHDFFYMYSNKCPHCTIRDSIGSCKVSNKCCFLPNPTSFTHWIVRGSCILFYHCFQKFSRNWCFQFSIPSEYSGHLFTYILTSVY